ncbi:hypothetical protein NLG97_g1714 [Lecanicillium saksenae]|uniref:Uncharacterized protein n=1 Tax=Lecanicillium saksenae TaxID=468837 RepID=A0ACC1R363_9HYPO|nr:hypothetical protein NLG97_g1714 [Lecanicillium saksenae]
MKAISLVSVFACYATAMWKTVEKSKVSCAGCMRGAGVTGALDDEGQGFCQHIVDTCGRGNDDSGYATDHAANVIVTWGNKDGHDFANCPSDVEQCKTVLNSIMAGCTGTARNREAAIINANDEEAGSIGITGQCFCVGDTSCG